MTFLLALWNDERGAVITAELIIVLTVLVTAMVAGFSALRNALVSEFADTGAAFGNLNQSFSYGGVIGHHAFTAGTSFFDLRDVEDLRDDDLDANGIVVCAVVAPGEAGVQRQVAPLTTEPVEVLEETAAAEGLRISILEDFD